MNLDPTAQVGLSHLTAGAALAALLCFAAAQAVPFIFN